MTVPDNYDNLGPVDNQDYEGQRFANSSREGSENTFEFPADKCANCDSPSVYTLDRPQFGTVSFCALHIPSHYLAEAVENSQNAELQSRLAAQRAHDVLHGTISAAEANAAVESTPDAPLEGVNDPEAVAKTAPVKTVSTPEPKKTSDK